MALSAKERPQSVREFQDALLQQPEPPKQCSRCGKVTDDLVNGECKGCRKKKPRWLLYLGAASLVLAVAVLGVMQMEPDQRPTNHDQILVTEDKSICQRSGW